ncbi:hypothetical protein [Salipiger mucosus]|uniref:hypothetical protein n=1 Tax=Salipiger mucosus TaxID=263378 RepID=UPI0003683018|nr:hypothetical protein [Salipiger mucosus]
MKLMIACITATIGLAGTASASVVLLNEGEGGSLMGSQGPGRGRGLVLSANENITIDSVGILADLRYQSYDFQIYAGDSVGTVLAEKTAVLGGTGSQYHDIGLEYSFSTGQTYSILFQPSDLGVNDWVAGPTENGYFLDSLLPLDVGPFTILDGFSGNEDGFSLGNAAHPNFRVNTVAATVPISPGGVFLLSALAGLWGLRASQKGA